MNKWILFGVMSLIAACGVEGQEGDACEADADCEEGLHCHIEDGGGVCEGEHEDEDHEGEDHEGEDHEGEE